MEAQGITIKTGALQHAAAGVLTSGVWQYEKAPASGYPSQYIATAGCSQHHKNPGNKLALVFEG